MDDLIDMPLFAYFELSIKFFLKRANRHRSASRRLHRRQPACHEKVWHKRFLKKTNFDKLFVTQHVAVSLPRMASSPDQAVEANLREGSEIRGEG